MERIHNKNNNLNKKENKIMAKNENSKEFTQDVVENQEEEQMEVIIEKKTVFERFMALKTWQKIAVVTLLTGVVAGGTWMIIKLINKKPEVVAEAIDTVVENSAEAVADAVIK